jgi:hypothetical protein
MLQVIIGGYSFRKKVSIFPGHALAPDWVHTERLLDQLEGPRDPHHSKLFKYARKSSI